MSMTFTYVKILQITWQHHADKQEWVSIAQQNKKKHYSFMWTNNKFHSIQQYLDIEIYFVVKILTKIVLLVLLQ